MPKRLLYGYELQTRLEKIMGSAGFELTGREEQPFESLKYKRSNPEAGYPDVIIFGAGVENTIKASAGCRANGQGFSLKTLKELLPEYPSWIDAESPENDQWVFNSKEELDKILDEIVDLVQNRLLPWFENPVNNPAGIDMSPKHKLTPAQLKAGLHESLHYRELALARAVKAGDVEGIKRHQRTIDIYKARLAELDE
jgi:hypothetical protein